MSARILLVDDEPALLKLTNRYLSRLGYDVECCTSADAAWRRFEAAPSSYSLLLVDMTIAGMSAEELFRKVLGAKPDVHLIACSGYAMDMEDLQVEGKERILFLQKPFAPAVLAEMVQALLTSEKNKIGN